MAGRSWASIVERADRIRGYGDFYHYHLLAAGKIEAVIESDVNILDIAALSIIVNEAGGVFTDLNGRNAGPAHPLSTRCEPGAACEISRLTTRVRYLRR